MDLPRAPSTLDAILDAHAEALGSDRLAYEHHGRRVFAFARRLDPAVDAELLAVACAFHDLGIWTAGTFDYLGPSVALAEAMRRGDWADVTYGWRRFGLSRAVIRAAYAAWPDAGFHRRLVALTWHRFLRHPVSPLPMLRW